MYGNFFWWLTENGRLHRLGYTWGKRCADISSMWKENIFPDKENQIAKTCKAQMEQIAGVWGKQQEEMRGRYFADIVKLKQLESDKEKYSGSLQKATADVEEKRKLKESIKPPPKEGMGTKVWAVLLLAGLAEVALTKKSTDALFGDASLVGWTISIGIAISVIGVAHWGVPNTKGFLSKLSGEHPDLYAGGKLENAFVGFGTILFSLVLSGFLSTCRMAYGAAEALTAATGKEQQVDLAFLTLTLRQAIQGDAAQKLIWLGYTALSLLPFVFAFGLVYDKEEHRKSAIGLLTKLKAAEAKRKKIREHIEAFEREQAQIVARLKSAVAMAKANYKSKYSEIIQLRDTAHSTVDIYREGFRQGYTDKHQVYPDIPGKYPGIELSGDSGKRLMAGNPDILDSDFDGDGDGGSQGDSGPKPGKGGPIVVGGFTQNENK